MGFSRKERWIGLPFPPPGELPNGGIGPVSPTPSALAGVFFTTDLPGSPWLEYHPSSQCQKNPFNFKNALNFSTCSYHYHQIPDLGTFSYNTIT